MAQEIGLVVKEFGYTVEEVLNMPASQFYFLLAWLDWYYRQVKK
ncbi:MAG: hypothetical protein QW761_00230 [Candidatus Aenigmatarchaeota archaeon]